MGLDDMRRADGWDKRLRELLDSMRGRPFQWGSNDCCTFAIADYEAMMGVRPPHPHWSDYPSAQQLVADRSLGDWLTDIVAPPVDGWQFARRGDLVLIGGNQPDTPHGELLGVVGGSMVCCLAPHGLVFLPIARGVMTWQVGE